MNKSLKIFLKILAVAISTLLITLIVFFVTLMLNWPWWMGIFPLFGLFAFLIGLILIYKKKIIVTLKAIKATCLIVAVAAGVFFCIWVASIFFNSWAFGIFFVISAIGLSFGLRQKIVKHKSYSFITFLIAIVIILSGLLSYSFLKNITILRNISEEFSGSQILQGNIVSDAFTMFQFHEGIKKIDKQNSNWLVPRLGLNYSLQIENNLKKRFTEMFRTYFLNKFDRQMADEMSSVNSETSDKVLLRYIPHLVSRINFLKLRLRKNNIDQSLYMLKPSYHNILKEIYPTLNSEVIEKIDTFYLSYVAWHQSTAQLNIELNTLQNWLKNILKPNKNMFHWLVNWVNQSSSGRIEPIKLKIFKGEGESPKPGDP